MTYSPSVRELVAMKQGGSSFIGVSYWNDTVVLAANTAGAYDLAAARTAMGLAAGSPLFVIFSADVPFWANFHETAAIPAVSSTDGKSPEFNPNQRYIDGAITSISLIATVGAKVSMQFYKT